MGRNILFISGGRRDGNTIAAVREAAAAAAAAGATVEIVEAIKLDGVGRGCVSCFGCQRSTEFRCVVGDEVARLMARLATFDTVVLATPIYFFSFSTQLKGVIDRFYSQVKYEGDVMQSPLSGLRFALLVTSGDGEANSGYDAVLQSYRHIVGYFGAANVGESYFPHCGPEAAEFRRDPERKRQAAAFGAAIAAE